MPTHAPRTASTTELRATLPGGHSLLSIMRGRPLWVRCGRRGRLDVGFVVVVKAGDGVEAPNDALDRGGRADSQHGPADPHADRNPAGSGRAAHAADRRGVEAVERRGVDAGVGAGTADVHLVPGAQTSG